MRMFEHWAAKVIALGYPVARVEEARYAARDHARLSMNAACGRSCHRSSGARYDDCRLLTAWAGSLMATELRGQVSRMILNITCCFQVRNRKGTLLGRRLVRIYTPGTATDLPQVLIAPSVIA